MKILIDKLSEEEKKELSNLLYAANEIIRESENIDEYDIDIYYSSRFYKGLYDLMYELGVWC